MCEGGIFLYIGLSYGVLIFSSFTMGVFFSRSADKLPTTKLEKLKSKISFDELNSIHHTSIAISVMSFLTFATTIISFIFFMIFPDEFWANFPSDIILLFFIFGLTVSEGMYTQQAQKHVAYNSYTISYDHKNAQKYIKKSIKELYNQGYTNLKQYINDYDFDYNVLSWSSIENSLGSYLSSPSEIFTYHHLWFPSSSVTTNSDYIVLSCNGGKIEAHIRYMSETYSIPVASTIFSYSESFTPKDRYCWYIKDGTDIKCKTLKGEKQDIDITIDTSYTVPTLTEFIVLENDYQTANYEVRNFPSSYHLLSYNEAYDDENFGHLSSTNNFKVKGEQFAKAYAKDIIDQQTNTNKYRSEFYLSPSKPSSVYNYLDMCENITFIPANSHICGSKANFDLIEDYLISNYKDTRKGKIPSSIKKYRKGHAEYFLDHSSWISVDLYIYTLANMIFQVIAAVLVIIGFCFKACI